MSITRLYSATGNVEGASASTVFVTQLAGPNQTREVELHVGDNYARLTAQEARALGGGLITAGFGNFKDEKDSDSAT